MRVRSVLVALALAAFLLPGARAAADDDVGCGLGTQLWEGSSGTIPKLLASTTNHWLGTQTFGITSGTLGCEQGGTITAEHRLNMFAGSNIDRLARDIAVGEGETLDTLASLLTIADADRPAFFQLTKANFAAIFPSEQVRSGEMLEAIDKLMAEDSQLARYVRS